MPTKSTLLILLFLIISYTAFADTFVVTSNADSGPGTLREALTLAAANGSVDKDYINFNLPGTTDAARTITVKTQLPDVTGNVIIDGTTQPSPMLGVSNARVIITVAAPEPNLNAFNVSSVIGQSDAVEFYGLYINGFFILPYGGGSGIVVNNDCKLVVGAPNKGNVICANLNGITGLLDNAVIQSNFIGIEPDGKTALDNGSAVSAPYQYNNLLIGGDSQADGNVITGGANYCLSFGNGTNSYDKEVVIVKNNFFGTDYKGTTALSNYFVPGYIYDYAPTIDLTITANVFSANLPAVSTLAVGYSTLNVKGNYFGTDKTQTYSLGKGGAALSLRGYLTSIVGGDAVADQNIFTGYNNPIFPDNVATTNIIKNKFYCNDYVFTGVLESNYVRIIKLLDNEVSGDAPPGAIVQLYYTTSTCQTCNPTSWFATVKADESGVWDYKGDTKQNIMASSTMANNTYGFQPFYISPQEVTVTNKDCHHGGSLEINEKRQGRFQFIWKDIDGKILGTGQKIANLDAGLYTLQINEGGNCPVSNGTFNIVDVTPHVYPQSFQLDCTNPTAKFTADVGLASDITVAKYYWQDANGKVISNAESIENLPAGKYYLYINDSNGCNSDKELYEVLPIISAPVIDVSKIKITDSKCDFADGAITGISISNAGNANFGWSTADGTIIGYGITDLNNIQPGQYYFFIDYNFNCPPVRSSIFTVSSTNGITLDDSNLHTTAASCSSANGSVTDIQVTGADQYKWADLNGNIVATTLNLQKAAAGDYIFTASNNFGCSKTKTYHVDRQPLTQYPIYSSTIVNTCTGHDNGAITVSTDALVKFMRWENSQGTTVAIGPSVTNLFPGDYKLYLTDQNGCENLYNSYTVNPIPQLEIVQGSGQNTTDECSLKTGGITNVEVTGGTPPYIYVWVDADNKAVSTTAYLTSVSAGNYTLYVNDTGGCSQVSAVYSIQNQDNIITAPSVNSAQVCAPGNVILKVNNTSVTYSYRLYDSENSEVPLDERASGVFKVMVQSNRSFYVSRFSGSCESERTIVKVSVGISAGDISNTFTPNGDGINDYWQIAGIENSPNASVQIFNRYGAKVFESKGYDHPFDGTLNGKPLPDGAYYYIVNLGSQCKLLSGYLMLVR
ncbi:MAG: hypothetical protein JWR50_196 [Mucilaginibacter sp.]|nr:hypothetical protein [Mucilaginibacter sp.]